MQPGSVDCERCPEDVGHREHWALWAPLNRWCWAYRCSCCSSCSRSTRAAETVWMLALCSVSRPHGVHRVSTTGAKSSLMWLSCTLRPSARLKRPRGSLVPATRAPHSKHSKSQGFSPMPGAKKN
eukprot:EG_transcript_39562